MSFKKKNNNIFSITFYIIAIVSIILGCYRFYTNNNSVNIGKDIIIVDNDNSSIINDNVGAMRVSSSQVEVTSISLNKSSTVLEIGKTETLKATINPKDATNKKVIWTSSNTNIVSVNSSGLIKAKKAGKAKITAKSINGKTATCNVVVVSDDLKVFFYNPGFKSDAILVVSGTHAMVVDGGFYTDERDHTNKKSKFLTFIENKQKELNFTQIDYYVATHGHKDHITMAGGIIKKFNIKNIMLPVGSFDASDTWYTFNNKVYKNYTLARMLERAGTGQSSAEAYAERIAITSATVNRLKALDEFRLGKAKITVLNPINSNWPKKIRENITFTVNANSLVLRVDYGKTSFLLAGDVNRDDLYTEIYNNLKKNNKRNLLDVDVYKNGHHHFGLLNGNGSLTNRLKKTSPEIVVMTTDMIKDNKAAKKQAKNIKNMCVYSVSDGNVSISSDGCKIKVIEGKAVNANICKNQLKKC